MNLQQNGLSSRYNRVVKNKNTSQINPEYASRINSQTYRQQETAKKSGTLDKLSADYVNRNISMSLGKTVDFKK